MNIVSPLDTDRRERWSILRKIGQYFFGTVTLKSLFFFSEFPKGRLRRDSIVKDFCDYDYSQRLFQYHTRRDDRKIASPGEGALTASIFYFFPSILLNRA